MVDSSSDPQRLLAEALRAVQGLRKKVETLEAARTMPIAVVGVGCRLPGNVHSPQDYWNLLENGVDAVGNVPALRSLGKGREPDAPLPAFGAFLDDVDSFDPTVFRMAPREAMYLDPQQRLLLEVAWEALEDAAISPHELQDSATGVFIGIASFDYGLLMASRLSETQIDASTTTGIFHSPAAGRLSYVLGLRGPSLAIDTACSSSLVAIHLACESLRRGECNMALVGGVNLMLAPLNHISTARAQMLSPDGRCKTFSDSANGYGRGEGCGMVVLKRLSDALASKDRILAVIRGSAVNQDGASGGLTVPSGPAQEDVIRKALSAAGMDPSAIDYVEAHGTGTALGDPIEVNALGEVFAKSRDASRPLWIGSCKTNIGHLEPAAGIVGFLKAVLQLHHGSIAPSLHFDRPNSRIAWNELAFRVPTETIPWRSEGGKKRAAGVSSFGFSGTNSHVILEEAPHIDPPRRSNARSLHLFVLSARSKSALIDLARAHAEHIERIPALDIGDVGHAANAGRAHFEHRLAVMTPSIAALHEKLSDIGQDKLPSDAWSGVAAVDGLRTGFVFPSLGPWRLQDVLEIDASEAAFRETLDELAAFLAKEANWSLRELLTAADGRLTRLEYALPIHYCLQSAFVALWRSWGVTPTHVFGHDAGEYAAACTAGIFTLQDGLRLVVAHARHLQAVRENVDASTNVRLRDEVAKVAAQIRYGAPLLEMLSAETRLSQPAYWANSDRDSWSLQRGTEALVAAGAQMSMEMGPACGTWPRLLEKLAVAYVAGQRVNWNGFTKDTWATKLALPTYSFQRRPYWFPCKLAFVFSGQGSQWAGMGKTLLAEEPVFREAMERCDRAIQREAGFSILDEIAKIANVSRIAETVVAQPALFAIEVSLATLLQSWGVRPELVIGHSVGEIAAAYVAGILDMEDAARIVALRARIMQKATGHGRMIAVSSTENTALGLLAGFETRVGIAAVNDPGQVVLSGDLEAIHAIMERLSARGIEYRDVPVEYAFHSPQMEPLRDEFVAALGTIRPRAGTIPMWSTVSGERIRGETLDTAYWGRNIRQTVRFSQAVNQAIAGGGHTFIEVGPHAVLSKNIEEILAGQDPGRRVLSTLRRNKDERSALLSMMQALELGQTQNSLLVASSRRAHPLLGLQFESSRNGEHFWEQPISAKTPAYLDDHRIQGEVVFPGTGYLEIAYAAGAILLDSTALIIDATSFEQMLTLPGGTEKKLQVVMTEQSAGQWTFEVASRTEGTKTWVKHAHGTVRRAGNDAASSTSNLSPRALAEKAGEAPSVGDHYLRMQQHGINYGPAFRGVNELWTIGAEMLGRVSLPENIQDDGYTLHPALLDACLQVSTALLAREDAAIYIPVGVGQVEVRAKLPRHVWVVASKPPSESVGANELACNVHIVDDDGRMLARIEGFRLRRIAETAASMRDEFDDCVHEVVWRRVDPLPEAQIPTSGAWLLFADQSGVADALHSRLRALGQRSIRILARPTYERIGPDLYHIDLSKPDDYRRMLREVTQEVEHCAGVVHCLSLDATSFEATTTKSLLADLDRGCVSVTCLVQAITRHNFRDVPRLVLVTRGAQPLSANIAVVQAPLLGLAKTIAIEYPELKCTRIDLDPASSGREVEFIVRELGAKDREDQIALRGEDRHVARMVRTGFVPKESAAGLELLEPAADRPFQLESRNPGVLDRLALYEVNIPEPRRGEVLIKVEAAGMNFLDVLLALGVLPDDATGSSEHGPRLGGECAGRVVAVGRGVKGFAPGDEVIALGMRAFGSHMVARHELVTRKPENLQWVEAATLPIAFLTAAYALEHVGKLRKGERVLIHAGAGGVGLAAIQWAQVAGAEVFATAGSDAKRSYLESLGVAHAFDSRSLRFADDIRRVTRGEGIDVVLNSLAGDFIPASLDLLRNHGRFIEIGKRDYYENKQLGLRPFLRNLSFSLVDLRSMMLDEPARVGELLRELMTMFAAGRLKPIPTKAFPISRAVEAFQHLAQAKNIGKIALVLDDPHARIVPARRTSAIEVYPDRSYLITGGLGGLGLSVARGLVDKGARSVVLVGRRRPNETAQDTIRTLEARGARVLTIQADVSQPDDVDAVLGTIQGNMPQLGGVIHAAAVLDDHTLLEQSAESFHTAFAAKALGAWNLHTACAHKNLDFFVMYSSVAALFGSAGQGNYAAANALLDALAHARFRRGLPGMTIQWGPFSEVGMAAARDGGIERLTERGAASFTPDEGLALLARLFEHPRPVTGLVRFNLRRWVEFFPTANGLPFFSEIPQDGAADRNAGRTADQMRVRLQNSPPNERIAILARHLFEQVAAVLRLDSSRFEPAVPFQNLGMDSLMAVELRNRIDATVGTKLPATVLFSYTTTIALAEHILESIGLSSPDLGAEPAVAKTELQQIEQTEREIAQSLDELTDDELIARLASKLD